MDSHWQNIGRMVMILKMNIIRMKVTGDVSFGKPMGTPKRED